MSTNRSHFVLNMTVVLYVASLGSFIEIQNIVKNVAYGLKTKLLVTTS